MGVRCAVCVRHACRCAVRRGARWSGEAERVEDTGGTPVPLGFVGKSTPQPLAVVWRPELVWRAGDGVAPGGLCSVRGGVASGGFGGALAGGAGFGAALGVFVGGDGEVDGFAALVLGVEFFEEGDAPSASGAGAEAFADEGGDGRVFAFDVGADLAQGDAEAEADVVVGVHGFVRG